MMPWNRRTASSARSSLGQRILLPGILLALLWGIEAVDWILGGRFDRYGIRPREISGLWGIPLAPFLHGGWDHLAANSVALLVLSWFVLLRGLREYVEASVMIILLGGFGTWLLGKPHTVHIGASGLIFGYFGYLVLRGFLDWDWRSIFGGIAAGVLYGGLLQGLLSVQAGISWSGHMCGFLAGLVAAWMLGRWGGKT